MKQLEGHRDYLYKIVRPKLHYLHRRLQENSQEKFQTVMRWQVDIYRKTDCNRLGMVPPDTAFDFEGSWKALEEALENAWCRYPDNAAEFESAGFNAS